MRNYARIAIFFSVLVTILFISPLVIGMYLQRHYEALLDVYNATQRVSVHVEHFDRGWFTSVATLRVQILDPRILQYCNLRGVESKARLGPFIVDQRIQHGPVFYHDSKELPYLVGLLAIQNNMRSAPQIKEILEIVRDIDYVSFRGNYYKNVELSFLNLVYPGTDIQIKIDDAQGGVWIDAKQKKLQGDVRLEGLLFINPDAMIVIPHVRADFDVNANSKLWLGDNRLIVPNISLIENGHETLSMVDLEFKGVSEVIDGMMSGNKEIIVNQMNIGDYRLGPFHFNISAKQLSAKAAEDMIEAYGVIRERGELYQSQLIQKMLLMVPDIFNKGTTVSLNNFDLKTQDGQWYMNGEIVWNMDKGTIPDQFNEILSAADAKIYLKIAKPLMNRWIEVASTLPWFNRISPELDHAYSLARYETILTSQLNAFGVLDLVDQGKLPNSDAKRLLALQKMNTATLDYDAIIKELLLNKVITGETSHMLLYLYAQKQAPLDSIRFLLQRNQKRVVDDMSLQLESWIKSGYIEQQQNDYVISFAQKKNRIKVNEKWLPE